MTSLSTTAYTPLEQLLLFQALRHEGTSNGDTISFSFNRISEELKAIPLVRNDPAYDADRLSPDALRQLYLWLLKEEVRRDLKSHVENETGPVITIGDASLATRKRKAPSPPLPTVQEAAKHSYLIPQLVSRLYATYRTKAVKELREHECQYDVLAREVGDVAASMGNGGPQPAQDTAQSPKPSSFAHTQPAAQRPDLAQFSKPSAAVTLSRQENGEVNAEAPAKRYSQAKIDAVINHGPEPQNGFSGHRRTSSNTTLPPLSEMAPQSPHFGIPPKMPAAVAPGMQPYLQQQYAHSPSSMHHPPYGPPHAHPTPGSQIQGSLSRPSSSPRPTLPLPPGMQLQHPPPQHAASPIMRGSNLPQQHYQPRHRPSIGPPPAHAYSPQLQISPDYYQSQPYLDRRISYQAPQPPPLPRYPVPPSHQGGYPLQPWPVDGSQQNRPPLKQQPTTQVQHFGQQPSAPLHLQRTPSYPQYPNASLTEPRHPAHARLITQIVNALATPPRADRKPVWKSERRPPPLILPSTLSAPDVEPLSPVLTRVKSPTRLQRSARKAGTVIENEHTSALPLISKARTRRTRDRSPHSVVSSTAEEAARTQTRSQSVATIAGADPATDARPRSRGTVKDEPSTPAESFEAFEHIAEPSATPASGPMTRKRRGTLQSQPQSRPKRIRQQSIIATHDADPRSPPPRPTTILATRNFNKMASTIMNDTTSHKHASYFAGPVRDRDASGYSEIIKQPQHLKSIRAAIAAGTRAIAAATSSLNSPAATPTAAAAKAAEGSTIELERSADLIPPKAIVNGAQLEKEVYRMFANAVMFNPGEDGLVADTREMFEDVEAKIREWRGAEREAGQEEEAVEESKGKRRKP
ncbi:hypothetical protein LTR35_001630 [Friedmanniomyces endolithicus]|uniref:Bromo domain-containing protein n=1 Tax=Friedmanniomyces endolithicus TaxID=329885 RepID=A0AAN6FRR6_9PEZI|nr:hypothetical protein LTR35_001630 [Friedmanniomyces endolithicus]KAK0296716.1 hypothetical protein LTS00_004516 [Friedmanniomyces endolithicus]KAK0321604.1 hypothetical protein LTR82_007572 [Friedmanniomyces endolithicus]KAK1011284.1 hypothetical protein LTR54_005202 [Friedmanniomyces endolithicus]